MKFDKLFFRHEDAVALKSADKAIIVEFIRWSCHFKESAESDPYVTAKYFQDGVWWMQDTQEAWQARLPWLSIRTIRRYLEEVCEAGFVAKRISGGNGNGREGSFYRVIEEARGQFDLKGLEANLTLARGQFDQGLEANLAPTSLSKNQTKNQTKNRLSSFWDSADPFAPVFENLNKLPICKAKFKTDEYRTYLTDLMKELSLTIEDLSRLSNEWQEHHNDATDKPKSPKGSFRTWATKNYNGRKSSNGYASRKTQAAESKPKPSTDDFDIDAFVRSRTPGLQPVLGGIGQESSGGLESEARGQTSAQLYQFKPR